MNAKTFFKVIFTLIMLLLLVLMGMNNRQMVDFDLPPILPETVRAPSALMYFAFFAVGVLTASVLAMGGRGGKSEGTSGTKSGKKS